jgi:hypothetical protein
MPDRKALDDVIFCAIGAFAFGGDALGFTEAERKEVYWAACALSVVEGWGRIG